MRLTIHTDHNNSTYTFHDVSRWKMFLALLVPQRKHNGVFIRRNIGIVSAIKNAIRWYINKIEEIKECP